MRRTKMVLVGLGSAALLATGGTATAGAASQGAGAPAGGPGAASTSAKDVDAKAWSCTNGAFCSYTKKNGGGTKHQRFANTNKNITGINSMRNNGDTSESKDHVKVKWNWSGNSTSHWGCFSPGETWSGKSVTVDAIRWVSSC